MKKISLILTLLLLFLTGCNQETAAEADDTLIRNQYAYQASYTPLVDETTSMYDIQNPVFSNTTLYYTAMCMTGSRVSELEYTDTPTVSGETSLFRLDPETNKPVLLVNHASQPLPAGSAGGALDILALTPGQDGSVWAYQQLFTYANVTHGVSHTPQLCRYSQNGELLEAWDTPDTVLQMVSQMMRDSNGCFYLSDWESVYILSPEGRQLHTIPMNDFSELCRYEDAVGAIFTNDGGQTVFRPLDPETGTFGEDQVVYENSSQLHPGNDEYEYLFDLNGDALYGYGADGPERLLTWSDYGVDCTYLDACQILENGDIWAATFHGDYGAELIQLRRCDPASLPERTVLTMASLNGMASQILPAVINFNRTHPTVQITVIDYAEYGSAGETMMNTQIMAGNIPDIFLMDSMSLKFLAQTNILQDLWPLIDADPEITRDSLMTHVFEVMSEEEQLYGIAPSFQIQSCVVPSTTLGEQTSWTLSELQEARAKVGNPAYVFGRADCRDALLFRLVGHNSDDFLDWKNGACSFDTPEFAELLEFVKEFPAEMAAADDRDLDLERVLLGEQLCAEVYISSFSDLQYTLKAFGEDVRFVGWPSQTGSNYLRLNACFGISIGCKNTDAAWEFGRMLLTETYQRDDPYVRSGLPTNKNLFEEAAKKAMSHSSVVYDQYNLGGVEYGSIELEPMTQGEYDRFMELYESCDRSIGYNDAVMTIVFDEVGNFFDGRKTAEETAKVIQNRVSLYMAEQRITP